MPEETKKLINSDEELSPWEIFKEEIVQLKWLVLVFCCILTFGSYYIFDFPGSLGTGKHHSIETKFYDHGKEYTAGMNLVLYSVYSWPNTVLAIFGGILIDKFLGLRKATILFCALVTIGAVLFWVGVAKLNYPLMVTARVVFGLGGESLSVAQSALVARWFRNSRGFALAFGITVSFSRVGSAVNFQLSPRLCESMGVDAGTFAGVIACLFSFGSAVALYFLDGYGERRGLVARQSCDITPPFKLADLKRLPKICFVIFAICVTIYMSLFPFLGVAKNFFEVKYGMSQTTASSDVSYFQFMCAGGSPVVGFIVDFSGRFVYWMGGACSFFVLIHIGFLLTSIPAPAMMVLLGVAYSCMVSSLWPSVPYCVHPTVVGLAYGVMTALQNAGLAIMPLIVGAVLDANTPPSTLAPIPITAVPHQTAVWEMLTDQRYHIAHALADPSPTPTAPAPLPDMDGFHKTSGIFICMAAIAVGFCVVLYFVDRATGGALNASPDNRKIILEEKEREYEQQDQATKEQA